MDHSQIEQIAWMIDPEAFSAKVASWERYHPGQGIWQSRRDRAHRTARRILNFIKED